MLETNCKGGRNMFKIFSKIAGSIKDIRRGKTSAIILCAGESTRFSKGKENKQMALVNGVPVILRTLKTFEETDDICEIILVVRKEDANSYKDIVCKNGLKKVKCIVIGGDTRQSSALRGFKHVDENSKFVAIHDGARCLVTPEIINKVINEADQHNAAAAATRITDTLKLADKNGFISKTVDRSNMWSVQTPQVFEKKLYMVSAYNAKEKGIEATDDCMLAEASGFKVKLVETGKENIKITVKDDIILAEQILASRGEEQ
ncbi:MAG: 2-C-methyl-D-erythritol 4-phosphate cytidylyltransferase [Ruminococcaceae bacterium]|nr:2-C-methyl-D-erythritol 4-phosphate cytidylyltransferase [Oscillospiraceae bacterium]